MASMNPAISIVRTTPRLPAVHLPGLRALAALLAQRAFARRAATSPPLAITVIVTGDALISRIHAETFGIRTTTDVITRSYEPVPGPEDARTRCAATGEIFINVQQAVRCGRLLQGSSRLNRRAWNPSMELALYLAHGMDHLSGAEDSDPLARARMRRRELGWLARPDILGYARGLLKRRHARK